MSAERREARALLRERPSWRALEDHAATLRERTLAELFEAEPGRVAAMRIEAAGFYADFSKNRIDAGGLERLFALARDCDLPAQIEATLRGEPVNTSEARPALHTALRAPRGERIEVEGRDVVPDVHAVLERMAAIADEVRGGTWHGATGRRIRSVVNLGIGGSDLGPRMACDALGPWLAPELEVRFVANVDPADLARALRGLDPAETLFVVCSKTFTTLETLSNARAARAWLEGSPAGRDLDRHMLAVSAAPDAVRAFGLTPDPELRFWDWVGGRYSLCSAIGLSLMIGIGPARFRELLAGAREVDEHFRSAPLERNLPVWMGLLSVWYRGHQNVHAHAVLPYAARLARFPAWLQQLTMESNGKRVRADGRPVDVATAPILFGEPGSDAQHAFFQLLHQGTEPVSCDFIGFAHNPEADGRDAHDWLVANLFAQSQALAFGRSAAALRADGVDEALIGHRTCPGNRPSTTLLARRLDPRTLGRLVALYEHRTLVEAAIWGINAFDQWGVELGKVAARRIGAELTGAEDPPPSGARDPSTAALIERYLQWRAQAPDV